MAADPLRDRLQDYRGKVVVLDTDTSLVYLGTLEEVDELFFTLTDADVHDMGESAASTPKEAYVLKARRHGLQKNRHRVLIRQSRVLSLSLLDDVVIY